VIDSTMDGTKVCPGIEMRQRHDADGMLRVTLIGELDLAVAEGLRIRLDQLQRSERRVRLDLSELEFIDCRGVDGILRAMGDARRNHRELEVDRRVSPGVRRITRLEEIASALWPAPAVGPVA
jgi:anti-anti-sigma factor